MRGNGKIIQELEAAFRGAGWNVIKVIWGREWDDLLARDVDGLLVEKMNEHPRRRVPEVLGRRRRATSASTSSGRTRASRKLVEHLTDDDLAKLRRGGHDYRKVYAAYKAATEHTGAPTVILAQTVKGWTLGPGVEARNITHQAKKLTEAELRIFRDRLELPIPDATLKDAPYYHPGPESRGGPVPPRAARGPRRPAAAPVVRSRAAAGAGPRGRRGVRRRAARRRSRRRWSSPGSCAT